MRAVNRLLAFVCIALVCTAAAGLALPSSTTRPVAGELILFWSDEPWPSLWSMRSDGSGRSAIFRTPQNAKRPTLSPDGAWVAFDGAPPGKPSLSDFDIQLVRLDGTRRKSLVESRATELDAQWSPDGALLSFSRWQAGADWRRSWIWTVRRSGSGLRKLTRGQFARWSPDGDRLVLDAPAAGSDGDIFVVDRSGGQRRRLLSTPPLEQPADWSPDGTRILFTRFYPLGGSDVFVMRVDGTGIRRLTNAPGEDTAATWSPDGSRILFTSERTGHEQVFVMNADGSKQRNLSRTPLNDFATGWH